MKTRLLCLSAAAFAWGACLQAAERPLAIDLEQSRVEIAVHASMDSFVGKLTHFDPVVTVGDDGRVVGAKIAFRFADVVTGKPSDGRSSGRSESLSRRFSRFYVRNLTQRDTDHEATRALANSESELNVHLEKVFNPTFESLSRLGYPGVSNPQLLIRSVLNPTSILGESAQVHYVLKDENIDSDLVLPDQYNGLGFKNLIYMVIEVLDFHAQWQEEKENRALLHLIIIEEPEAHLHAQLQQVFIKNILKVISNVSGEHPQGTQLFVTTHSPHILYESGFKPIRYFRRSGGLGTKQYSVVLDLSEFYAGSEPAERDFLQRYMKLTHCDLFFADAAILVEGNVERLVLPMMIASAAPNLQSKYLSILEVGGAYAHIFKGLIEFLGQPVLIITDIDSVSVRPAVPSRLLKKGVISEQNAQGARILI